MGHVLQIPIITALLLMAAPSAAWAETPPQAAKIVVFKSKHTLQLLDGNAQTLKTFPIAIGAHPKGPKTQEGDEKTPEGLYTLSGKSTGGIYHLQFKISYPNASDRAAAKALGVSPGGGISLHGLPKEFSAFATRYGINYIQTNGCIMVSTPDIDTISAMVKVGTPIEIQP